MLYYYTENNLCFRCRKLGVATVPENIFSISTVADNISVN